MKNIKPDLRKAWLMLSCALLIHVIDEAINDFLSIYNPVITDLRELFPLLPLPVFSFTLWLTGLLTAIFILFLISFFASKNSRWIMLLSYILGIIMILNGLGHLLGSVYLNAWMPGVYSTPLLIISSWYLIWSATGQKSKV